MDVHVPVATNLIPAHSEVHRKRSTWTAPTVIALLALASVLAHLALRFLFNVPRIAWQAPLILALIAGGLPLLVPLTRKLLALEFGSDHLAGISIVTSVVLGEYLVGVIVILMLSGERRWNNSPAREPPRFSMRSPDECRKPHIEEPGLV